MLNSDGTPNPLPIIDVYGTRRGPKRKPEESGGITQLEDIHYIKNQRRRNVSESGEPSDKKPTRKRRSEKGASPTKKVAKEDDQGMTMFQPYMMAQMQQLQKTLHQNAVAQAARIAQVPPFTRASHEETGYPAYPPSPVPTGPETFKCAICNFETSAKEVYNNHMMLHAAKERDSVPEPAIKKENAEQKQSASPTTTNPDYLEYIKRLGPLLNQQEGQTTPSPSGISSSTQNPSPSAFIPGMMPPSATGESQLFSRLYLENMVKNAAAAAVLQGQETGGALDLSQDPFGREPGRPPQAASSGSTGSSGQGGVSSTKSRRKGKAYKIERKRDDDDGHRPGDNSSTASGTSGDHDDVKSEESERNGTTLVDTGSAGKETDARLNGSHVCKFCDIAFMDSIMYTIHMGYHGFQDPFKCNICGDESGDKVSFFLHIARKPHQ